MPNVDLSTPETLRRLAAEYAELAKDPAKPYRSWCDKLVTHLEKVAGASREVRASREFQAQLWNDEIISSTGQGNINMDAALDDAAFRDWLADRSLAPLPEGSDERTAGLEALAEEIKERLSQLIEGNPKLKTFRVLASFYPLAFTTVADAKRMRKLHMAMLPGSRASEIGRHQAVLRRLDEVLGPAPQDLPRWVERMTLAWRLVEVLQEESPGSKPVPQAVLVPLPASRRAKGLTSVRGYFDSAIRVLDYVGEGTTWSDLNEFWQDEHPTLKAASINANLNVLRRDLGLLVRSGDEVKPTDLGRRLLADEDPSVLAPTLLTRILGIDHALVALRDRGALPRAEVVRVVQQANVGWTTKFAPSAIVAWLRSFSAIEDDGQEAVRLTERGRQWAALVTWTPERYEVAEEDEAELVAKPLVEAGAGPKVPLLAEVMKRLPESMRYSPEQVAALHAGLWAHPTRHLAILTGLSGSGKTSLARDYAKAVIAATAEEADPPRRFLVVPVAPGWTDPSSLLGYLNPLRAGEYVATEFVSFLVSCVEHPEVIHFAVLDEMNLSHPEQYLAPLLSGMELGSEPITLHDEPDLVEGIPGRLERYPANLVLIGTVNMDETTHGLSDKILDRAVTLEFWHIDLAGYPRWGQTGLDPDSEQRARTVLGDLLETLAPLRLHFGWRVVDDVMAFLRRAAADGGLDFKSALDWIIYSKVVPKLRGHDSPQFRDVFARCQASLAGHGLPRSRDKLGELIRDLQETGSARFWR